MIINYKESLEEFISYLNDHKNWVLATSCDDEVTARMISIVNVGYIMYFQTAKAFEKYQQIINIEKIALCIGNYQVKAVAKEIGHPFDEKNIFFKELYKKHHLKSYERYSKMSDEVIIKVNPTEVKIWKYIDNIPFQEIININDRKAEMHEYKIEQS